MASGEKDPHLLQYPVLGILTNPDVPPLDVQQEYLFVSCAHQDDLTDAV